MSVELDFIPVRGKESTILTQTPREGFIYYATDTGKIFLDTKDEITGEVIHLPVGGSGASVLYAQANNPTELPDGSLVLSLGDLEDESASVNIDDLIINSDGKFLRVSEVGEEEMTCRVIAVSGTGGGGGDGPGTTNGTAKIEYIGQSSLTVLKGSACDLKYLLTAFDAAGDPVIGAGEAVWAVNNVVKHTEMVYPGENKFNIGPYLVLGAQTITLKISINTGGATNTVVRKTWTVTSTELKLTWEHSLNTVYDANRDIELSWTPYGILDKTTYIVVDDVYSYTKENGTASGIQQSYTLPVKLSHGSHTISMYLQAMLNGETLKTDVITHEFIVADGTDQTAPPVIVIGDVAQSMSQYDTMYIPFVVYDHTKSGLTNEVIYLEDDIERERQDINNGTLFSWSYTPTTYGYKKLTIACGNIKRNLQITVNELDLGSTAEVEGYAFKLKASEFNGNNALKNWNSNGVTATFSEDFDWINGGIKSELDESGNTRQYINVRAGDTMTINYKPFENNISRTVGKCIKIIFKATGCRDYDAQVLRCYDDVNNRGLILNAQTALFNSASNHTSIPYCEDTYIELEIDITDTSNSNGFYYITSWIDGVPAGIQTFSSGEAFNHNSLITIGSEDANVQIYMIKIYEKHINDAGHLANFIMDAPNATEMLSRFIRNDILDERGEISPTRLAEKNPNCRVHCYTIPRMTTTKDDKIKNCEYIQYHGSSSAVLSASGVTTRVQGTSSAGYGLAAYNLDAKFENGFDYPDGTHSKGWSMDEKAIPVNYFTTKVNVASCENANNALNQEWYNKFQPYVSPNRARIRADGKEARDCMQFYPGVLFIEDHNQESSFIKAEGVGNNVFKDTPGYIDNPYPKLYAVCNMGNSKKNLEVFHDVENPLECCIEVADNQNDIQKMIICAGLDTFGSENVFIPLDRLFDDEGNDIQVTYSHTTKGGVEETRTKTAYTLWRNANMSKAAFEFRYPDKFGDNEGDSFEERFPEQARIALVGWFNFVKWIADNNPAAATNEPLAGPVTFGSYTFTDSTFSKKLKGLTVNDFAGTYDTDSEQYRMAKMLSECEQHLVMDSVMFHYLFIERHTMVDNVAKNTFWSSGDAIHWDLTKNYDNDTSDGNDNEGKLTLTYGFEPGDQRDGVSIFNGPGSVWLEFTRRLPQVAGHLHRILETDDKGDPWDSTTYLKAFEEWQSAIPERCWIEAYYRLYVRPWEVYEANFLEKLEGGKKTHQRKQYETYQNMYISSKYFGKDCENARLQFRPNVDGAKAYELPMKMYADCYVMGSLGQGTGTGSINYQRRTKRGETFNFVSPTNNLTDATAYFYPSIFYQEIGSNEKDFKFYNPKSFDFSGANKLRTLALGNYEGEDTTLNTVLEEITFKGNSMLEELSAAGYSNVKLDLDLSGCPNLKTLDTRLSSFTSYSFAPGSPLETAYIQSPTSLNMKELSKIETFSIADYTKLIGLYLDSVDKSVGFNSLNIVKERISVNSQIDLDYNLKNIVWLETDSSQIDNNSIKYLDFLLTKNAKADGDIIDAEAGLTGTLTITSDAYNDENSYLIYDKYSKVKADKKSYPNLDIIFTGDNASMPKITIVNQAGETVWSRRIKHNNSGIDLDFLSSGPNGTFIPFETTEDQAQVYIFTNKYKINGIEIEADENGFPVYNEQIVEDLIIEPIFDIQVNKHPITVYNIDKSVLLQGEYDYGTPLYEIVKDILSPRRDDSDLGDYYTYRFIGYNIGSNSTPLTLEQLKSVRLRDETILTAAYEQVHVYLCPTDETYFDINNYNGYITLKKNTTISGKVVIPKTINGKTVKGLGTGAFQHGYIGNTSGITHIFFEPLSYTLNKVTNEITSYTENTNITSIDQLSFNAGNLKMIELPSSIISAKEGDNNSFDNTGSSCVIVLSENMTELCNYLFANYDGSFKMKNAEIGTISLPNLTKIGKNVFAGVSKLNSHTLILPNNIEFGGYVGTSAKEIRFGEPGVGIIPNLRFTEGVEMDEANNIWGVVQSGTITLYGKDADNSPSKKFLESYFSGSISTSN